MRFRIAVAAALVTASAGSVGAQGATANAQCKGITADACQQAVDLFSYVVPQLGTGITGGNTTLAQGGNLGGRTLGLVPKIAIDVRANLIMGNVPVLQTPTVTLPAALVPPTARNFTTSTAVLGLPAVDAAIGVFKGIPLGVSSVGGVDVLLSAAYVPSLTTGDITVTPDTPLKIGYGVRVGLLQESLVAPGIGFSFIMRDLPTTTITATTGGTTLTVKDLALKTKAWRLTVSKSLLLFGLAAGVGQDMYSSSTSIQITPPTPAVAPAAFALSQDVTRTNYFADVSMNLLVLKLVGTVGMVSGGEIKTYNTFDNLPDKSRIFGSVGVRIGL